MMIVANTIMSAEHSHRTTMDTMMGCGGSPHRGESFSLSPSTSPAFLDPTEHDSDVISGSLFFPPSPGAVGRGDKPGTGLDPGGGDGGCIISSLLTTSVSQFCVSGGEVDLLQGQLGGFQFNVSDEGSELTRYIDDFKPADGVLTNWLNDAVMELDHRWASDGEHPLSPSGGPYGNGPVVLDTPPRSVHDDPEFVGVVDDLLEFLGLSPGSFLEEEQEGAPGFDDLVSFDLTMMEEGMARTGADGPPPPLPVDVITGDVTGPPMTSLLGAVAGPDSPEDRVIDLANFGAPSPPASSEGYVVVELPIVSTTGVGSPSKKQKTEPVSPVSTKSESRKQRKMDQNRTAALRYRQKKRAEKEHTDTECLELTQKNSRLQKEVGCLSEEIKYLRSLMKELKTSRKRKHPLR